MAEPTPVIPRVCFCFEIPRISRLEKIWSPEFIVQGIPWKIKVRKENEKGKSYLGIFLHCAKKDRPPNFAHAAWASFKLLSFSDTQNAIERRIEPYVFDEAEVSFGFAVFIEWNSLFDVKKNYVKDDTIKFHIKIEAEPQNQINRSKLKLEAMEESCACQTKLRLTVSNMKNLMAIRSPEFIFRDLQWKLTVYKDQSNLGVRIMRKKSPNITPCQTKIAVKLLSNRANVKPIEQIQIKNMGSLQTIETDHFLSWAQLFKPENGFVENDSITLEVGMKGGMDEVKRRKMQCVICSGNIDSQEISCPTCGHIFCTPCITNTVKDRKLCPSCNAEVTLKSH